MKKNTFTSLLEIAVTLVIVGVVSHFASGWIFGLGDHIPEAELFHVFLGVALLLLMSFLSFYVSHNRPVPTFVSALLLGIAAKPLLAPLVENHAALSVIVSIAATFILFQGGLETPFANFRRLFAKIAALAFPGVLISALGLSLAVAGLGSILGVAITVTTAVLLGAVLASTDPAAIIPLLQGVRFKESSTKDIVVSESAMNDVVGALLTLTLVGILTAGTVFASIPAGYATLFSGPSALILIKQMGFGIAAGILGYLLLRFFSWHKKDHGFESGSDSAFFLFVPLFAFAAALVFGGSGYLAAFIASLLFHQAEHLKGTGHFFESLIDGYAKPAIFLLLGALVDLSALAHYAVIGVLTALVFIFILRPLMVWAMLYVFMFIGKERLSWQQLVFISWVRETGAIPAVLLVTVVSLRIPGTEPLVPIGMWVILLTLLIQPPFTPWLAKRLQLTHA